MPEVDGSPIGLADLETIATGDGPVALSDGARNRMAASRAIVEQIVAEGKTVYGVSTGFGKLSDVTVPKDRLAELQLNLVRSHACGVGEPLEQGESLALLWLRANVLAMGFSGARPEVADHLLAMYANGLAPLVPSRGSVGASGDLAPLAHVAMSAIGEGEIMGSSGVEPAASALAAAGLAPLVLKAKEGLSLLNGTQAMLAVGGLALARAQRVERTATVAAAMSLEALRGTPAAFDARIQNARPHPGQADVARRLASLLDQSEIRESHRENDPRVQDAYSLRCVPQVHGAAHDALRHCEDIWSRETGSATDNPLVFENGDVVSGGNFHGAPLALAYDYAAIAVTDLMSISERRIERLVNPDLSDGLPAFLARDPGLGSGYMIPQVAAASLLVEARILAHPASVDNVPTSAGKEDHVSMGMTSALKLKQLLGLAERIVAIELCAAAEGIDHWSPLKPGKGVAIAVERVREHCAPLVADRSLSPEFESVSRAVRQGRFDF